MDKFYVATLGVKKPSLRVRVNLSIVYHRALAADASGRGGKPFDPKDLANWVK